MVAGLAWLGTTAAYGVEPTAPVGQLELGGQPLSGDGRGSTDRNSPTQLQPGLWRDTLGGTNGSEDIHYFEYHRAIADSTVHLGVIGSSADPDGDGIGISAVAGPEETDCGSDTDSAPFGTAQGPFGAAVEVGPSEPDTRDGACLTADSLRIQVDRGSSSSETELPVAIKVVEEAPVPVDAVADLPQPAEELRYDVPADPAPSDVEAGETFDDAPLLEPGADGLRFGLEVPEGDVRLVRLPVTWGQQVVAAAEVPAMDEATLETVSFVTPTVDLRIVEPDRNTLTTYAEGESSSGSYGADPQQLSVGTSPLRYLNRFDDTSPTLPGHYWVVVTVEPLAQDADRDPLDVPVTLTVAVTGEPAGAPDYQPSILGQGGAAAPDAYAAERPFLVGDDQFAAVASGSPASANGSDDDSWWGPRRYAGLGLGAVSLALCALGGWRLARR